MIVRHYISNLLQGEQDIEIVAEAENGEQALEFARQTSPEVVIMDVEMPVMNGIEATRILSKEMPQIKVIALSMHDEEDSVLAIVEAGAVAFLTKGGSYKELLNAIRSERTRLVRYRSAFSVAVGLSEESAGSPLVLKKGLAS
jgi:DNA-binding NarL/FixJ family response regulator